MSVTPIKPSAPQVAQANEVAAAFERGRDEGIALGREHQAHAVALAFDQGVTQGRTAVNRDEYWAGLLTGLAGAGVCAFAAFGFSLFH
jgi:hypothetical protein